MIDGSTDDRQGQRGAAPAGRGPARPEAFREGCKTDREGQQQDPFDDPKYLLGSMLVSFVVSYLGFYNCFNVATET